MKCLITGINGFVGGYLAEYLLNKTNQVFGTFYPKDLNKNIKDPIQSFFCDLTIPQDIDKLIKEIKPEFIFHLAGQSFIPYSWDDPATTFKTNVLGPIYLLEAVKKHAQTAKILIVGSSDEYGSVNGSTNLSEDAPLNPDNPYGISKACADLLSHQLGKHNNLKIVRTRSFLHIGPGQSEKFVVSDFCKQIALIEKGEQPPVMKVGNLESKRDFTDVRDIVNAYWLALEKGIPGEVYNITSQNLLSIQELLDKLISMTDTKITVEIDPKKIRTTDTKLTMGDSTKFRTQTMWQPEIPIEKTLQDTLDWWRKQV